MSKEVDNIMEVLECAAVGAEKGNPPGQLAFTDQVSPKAFKFAVDLDGKLVRTQLDRIIVAPRADLGLDVLHGTGLLKALLPEVSSLVGFGGGEWGDKDVWKHTKTVVIQADARLETRWGALFHDIGKVKTRSVVNGEVHFLGHDVVGAKMFERLEHRTKLFSQDPTLRDTVHFLVLNHLRATGYDSSWTDSAVRRFARDIGCHLRDLMNLSRADLTTGNPKKKARILRGLDELELRIKKLAEEDAKEPLLPSGIGDAIMKSFNLKPSRLIGDVKKKLEEMVSSGEVKQGLTVDQYISILQQDQVRFGL